MAGALILQPRDTMSVIYMSPLDQRTRLLLVDTVSSTNTNETLDKMSSIAMILEWPSDPDRTLTEQTIRRLRGGVW